MMIDQAIELSKQVERERQNTVRKIKLKLFYIYYFFISKKINARKKLQEKKKEEEWLALESFCKKEIEENFVEDVFLIFVLFLLYVFC
jgi:hypothetical protein